VIPVLYPEHASMGYRDKYRLDLSGRDRPPTRFEWVAAGALILMGALMMLRGIMGESSPGLLNLMDMWPIAASELVLAWLFWLRARNHSADERYSARSLRLTALLFAFLAAATIAVSFLNF
jgi:hypothetical protein